MSDNKSQEGSQQPGGCSPNQSSNQLSQYTPTKLCTSLEMAKEVAACHVLTALNVEHYSDVNNNNNGPLAVSDDITSGVSAMTLSNNGVKGGYTTFYNGDGAIGGYSMYNGMYSPPNDGYTGHY